MYGEQPDSSDEDDGKDGGEGQPDVPQQLVADDLVRLPGGVDLRVRESVRGRDQVEKICDSAPGRDVLVRVVHEEVFDGELGGVDLWCWRVADERLVEYEIVLEGSSGGGEEEIRENC